MTNGQAQQVDLITLDFNSDFEQNQLMSSFLNDFREVIRYYQY